MKVLTRIDKANNLNQNYRANTAIALNISGNFFYEGQNNHSKSRAQISSIKLQYIELRMS